MNTLTTNKYNNKLTAFLHLFFRTLKSFPRDSCSFRARVIKPYILPKNQTEFKT